jgi:hypothetical protein
MIAHTILKHAGAAIPKWGKLIRRAQQLITIAMTGNLQIYC